MTSILIEYVLNTFLTSHCCHILLFVLFISCQNFQRNRFTVGVIISFIFFYVNNFILNSCGYAVFFCVFCFNLRKYFDYIHLLKYAVRIQFPTSRTITLINFFVLYKVFILVDHYVAIPFNRKLFIQSYKYNM